MYSTHGITQPRVLILKRTNNTGLTVGLLPISSGRAKVRGTDTWTLTRHLYLYLDSKKQTKPLTCNLQTQYCRCYDYTTMMRLLKYLLPNLNTGDPPPQASHPKSLSCTIESVKTEHRKPRVTSVMEVGDVTYIAQDRPEVSSHCRHLAAIQGNLN